MFCAGSINVEVSRIRLQQKPQSFLSNQCDSCISPENGEFDVRWVRFPKHILLISTLFLLESVGLEDSPDWVQR